MHRNGDVNNIDWRQRLLNTRTTGGKLCLACALNLEQPASAVLNVNVQTPFFPNSSMFLTLICGFAIEIAV